MDEKAYTDIYNYQSSSTYPANASKNDKRALRQKVEPFTIINERLHHKGCKGKLQQVVKAAEVQDLLQQMYESVIGGMSLWAECHTPKDG